MIDTSNLPNYQRQELKDVLPDLALMADLLGGTRQMHKQSRVYIRKWIDELDAVYEIRCKMANVFGGLSRTLSGCVGVLYAKTPAIEWNESQARIEPHWNNLDTQGTIGHVLLKRFSEHALRDGLAVILVDHTPPPPGILIHSGNEDEFNIRPSWAIYQRCQIWSWRLAVIGNKRVLTQIVFHEIVEIEKGSFGTMTLHQWRILSLQRGVATWRVLRMRKEGLPNSTMNESDLEPVGAGVFKNRIGELATALPVNIAYTGRTDAPMCASMPLLDVAWANLAHWQQSTDLRFYRALCAFPQPTVSGKLMDEPGPNGTLVAGRLRTGPMVGIQLTENGKFAWSELQGSSMDQIEKGIQEAEREIAQTGMSFMFKDTRAAETAEAKRLDATAENSTLGTAAQGIEDAGNMAFEWHAWYMGIPKESAPVLKINKDFESSAMDSATMLAYVAAIRDAGLPVRILLEAWKQGGRLPADADLDALEAEMLTNAAQKEAQTQEIANANPNNKPKAVDVIGADGKKRGRLQPAA